MDCFDWKKTRKETFLNIRCDLLIGLFLIIVTLAVYNQTRNYEFVSYDDPEYVYKNPHIRAGLTLESIQWAFTAAHSANWHPVTWLSHMLDVQLYGMTPGPHHLTNVLFHIANTLLLFLILGRMTGKLWQSACVAALFALHPLHVESVAWVSERKDVLCTLFWLLTMGSYIRYVEQPGLNRYLPVLLFFVLGLMAKPMLITLPFVLLLLDYWPLNRLPVVSCQLSVEGASDVQTSGFKLHASVLWEKIPLFALAAISAIVTFLVQKSEGAVGSLDALPLTARIANALVSYVSYVGKMIWPLNLAVFYPHPEVLPAWQIAGACLLLISVTLLAIWQIRKRPFVAVGWLWYMGTLVPVIGLVQVGRQSMADRYTYIPLIGLFIIIAWGIPDILARWRGKKYEAVLHKTMLAATAVCLSAFTALTWLQVRYWSDSITLYEHSLEVTGDNYTIHYNMGNAFFSQDRFDQAGAHYLSALRADPESSKAHNNLGLVLARTGQPNKAFSLYVRALRIDPQFSEPHDNLGNLFASQGRLDKAIAHYLEALRLDPEFPEAHNNLGLALIRIGKIEEADAHFRRATEIKPDYADAHRNLGRTLALKGKLDKAVANLHKAMKISLEEPDSQHHLKNLSERKKELDAVIEYYQKALSPQPGYAKDALNIDNYAKVDTVRKEYDKLLLLIK
ncbi:tetratricopeptide repeat protein [Desulfobacterales bacterium HSG2]|nr:tetratricopeptide repeat protein [Desulfobacterales bacterium HSG2]